jgi:hypothetical protein
LKARAVPLRFWPDGLDWLAQPLLPLEPGAHYSLALQGAGLVEELRVASDAGAPPVRVFPPPGSAKHAYALYCGVQLAADADAVLEPGRVPMKVVVGAVGSPLDGCVELRTRAAPAELLVGPPTLGDAPLDPSPFVPAPPSRAADCEGLAPAAGGCLEVLDDRVLITQGPDDALWVLSEPEPQLLALRAYERSTVLRGLAPASTFELRGEAISSSGAASSLRVRVTTAPERRHVVINEVLANALGAEPASEWIELINDSERSVSLGGLWLEDATGKVPLPELSLHGRELVLLIPRGAMPSTLDVPFAAEARLIELPTLGERGLSNAGEPLLLVGPEGVVSSFPALAAPHAGRSQARKTPDAPDQSASSFAEHGGLGASPGAPNVFD